MLEVNNCFGFHRTCAVDIQSIVKVLRLIHDFLACGNIVKSTVSILPIVLIREVSLFERIAHSVSVPLLVQIPCRNGLYDHLRQTHKFDCMFDKLKLELCLASPKLVRNDIIYSY